MFNQLKQLIPTQVKRSIKNALKRPEPQAYLPSVQYQCDVQFIGGDYGGAPVCTDLLTSDSVVYSVGVGMDVAFDLHLMEHFGVHIHAFDPTPKSIAWVAAQQLPPQFHFYPYGLAAVDGDLAVYLPENPDYVSVSVVQKTETEQPVNLPMKRLGTLMAELGHTQIDLLQMDIEGAEYDVVADIVETDANIRQLSIEFHHRFKGLGIQKTKDAVAQLQRVGYQVAHAHPYPNTLLFIKAM